MSNLSYPEVLIASRVSGTAVTAAAATSVLPTEAVVALQAGFIKNVGQRFRITAGGKVTVAVTTPGTPKWTVKMGATTVCDLAVMTCGTAGYANYAWWLVIDLVVRAVGAGTSTTFLGSGQFVSDILTTGSCALPYKSAPAVGTGVDWTAALAPDLVWTQTAATGSITCDTYTFEALN